MFIQYEKLAALKQLYKVYVTFPLNIDPLVGWKLPICGCINAYKMH